MGAIKGLTVQLRALRRGPALATAAIITLALGVRANTAIFSAVNAVILRPLPFPAPHRLVMLWEQNPDRGWYQNAVAPANYLDWREQVAAFSDAAAYIDGSGTLTPTGHGEPHLVAAERVTGNFFAVLGVRPELGRTFRDAETWDTGAARIGVISDRLWRPQLGVWLPMRWNPTDRTQLFFRRAHNLRVVARVRPDVSLERANAELQTVVHRLQLQYPETNTHMGAGMTPLHESLVGDTRLPLLVLLGAMSQLPLTGTEWTSDFSIAGRGPDEYGMEVAHREVMPGYFRAMRVPVLKGRGFTEQDRDSGPQVVVINCSAPPERSSRRPSRRETESRRTHSMWRRARRWRSSSMLSTGCLTRCRPSRSGARSRGRFSIACRSSNRSPTAWLPSPRASC